MLVLVSRPNRAAADPFIRYICDHHLSILYGRSSIVREDASISGWEELMKSSAFTESDKRLVSQMALLIIMSNVRELFGPDTGEPVPRAFATQLSNFSRQVDQWMGQWTTELLKLHQFIGEFPTKGVILHHHLAKLHLHSHVFRGLKGAPVPPYFQDSAVAAVSAATSIVEMLLSDYDIREGLAGIPHYIHVRNRMSRTLHTNSILVNDCVCVRLPLKGCSTA